jgi:outer membrane protein
MTFKTLAAATCVAALTLSAAGGAFAQAGGAAPAAAPAAAVKQGPPVPGVCVLASDDIIQESILGKYILSRLRELQTQVEAELKAEGTAIDTDAKAFDAQRATLDQNTLEKRASDLQVRVNAFGRKRDLRGRELQLTSDTAMGRLDRETRPVIDQVYQQRNCSMLVQAGALIAYNPAMDVTPQVMTGLNARIQRFDINRQRLDQPAPAGQ